tara:strand:- start:142 stop:801 length:660 start_codon:yes stop_codon:yes gene_type:complete
MQHFISQDTLLKMKPRYRAQLINSLSGFKSANLIGTRDEQGNNNLAMFSSVVHLGASPALVGFITRPNSVARHTLANIIHTKHFTINQVHEGFWRAAHQTSASYNAEQSEFEQTDLTPQDIDGFSAPFVKESLLKYALTLREIVPIELNGTQLVIGEISDIICDDMAIKADGYIDIESLHTVAISGLDSYHTSKRLSRLSYAKPGVNPQDISLNGVIED